MPPRVSVVMPAYNAERFLEEAVGSILGQTFADLELIVVDDGSTDGTAAVLASVRDPRLRVLRQPGNRGVGAAFNLALDEAAGELIATQDADDASAPTRLAAQVALLDANPDVVVAGTAHETIDEHGASLGVKRLPTADTAIRWRALFTMPFSNTAMMFRARVARDHGLRHTTDWRFGGTDHRFACALLAHGRGANLDEALVRRRIHPRQVTATGSGEQQSHSDVVTLENIRALGVVATLADAHALRELYFRPPDRLAPADLRTAALLLDVFEAFRRQAGIDPESSRRIGRGLLDTILARSRGHAFPGLVRSGLLPRLVRLDPLGVAGSPTRWLARRRR